MTKTFKDINGVTGMVGTKVKVYNPITNKMDIEVTVKSIHSYGRRGTIINFNEKEGSEIATQVEILG